MKLKPKKRCVTPQPHTDTYTRSKGMLNALCERALMGGCVPVENSWVDYMTHYMCGVLSASYPPGTLSQFSESAGFSMSQRISKLGDSVIVTHITTCMVYQMPCIVYVLKGEDIVDPFTEDYGSGYPSAFCYVFNPTADEMCSEYGDCFFELREDGLYHRVS